MIDTAGPARVPGEGPALSVVLVCATGRRNLRRTLAAIASQTIADRIEALILTTDEGLEAAEPRLLGRLHSYRTFREDRIDNVDFAAGRLVVAARSPVVASIEDHAFPEPDWAEHVLAQFEDGVVAVGSALVAANPGSSIGLGNMLIAMGDWNEATPEGDIGWIQLHNCAFRREALAALADEAEGEVWPLFSRESDVLLRLRERGRLRFAPRARVRHLNPSRPGATIRLRFAAGRLAAANRWREESWGWPKRVAYALGSPLIPFVRYLKLRPVLFGRVPGVTEARLGAPVLFGLLFDGLGQAAAFLAGPGDARERLAVAELDRYAELSPSDEAAFRTAD